MLWGVWAGFVCKHILSRWNPPSGAVEMATVTSVPVLQCKMGSMFFFTVKTCLCALSERSTCSFLPFLPVLFCGGPLYFAHFAKSDRLWFPFSTAQQILPPHFGQYGFWLGQYSFWLAKTSNKPISLTTRLAVNPNLWLVRSPWPTDTAAWTYQ